MKDQTEPSTYTSSENEVKAIHRGYSFIYIDGSVLNVKPAATAFIDNHSSIECHSNRSSIFSVEIHALYRDHD